MKSIIKIFSMLVLLYACGEQPIVIKNIITNGSGIIMFGSTPSRSFYINENLGDSLNLVWNESTTGSYGNHSPVIFDNYILITDHSGNITGYDRKTGLKIGSLEFKGEIAVTPVISNFKVFYVGNVLREEYSILYSYDLVHGKILSEFEFKGISNNEIIFEDGMLYILTTDGMLHKFNDVGYLLGEIDTKSLVQSDPAASGNFIYWGNQNGEILSVDKTRMKINYRKKITGSFESGISIENGYGYIGDSEGNVICLDLASGNVFWKYSTRGKIKNHIAVDKENVYVGNLAGYFYCLNKLNGRKKYELKYDGLLNSTPLVFNDNIVLPDLNRGVHIIDKQSGKKVSDLEFDRRVKMTPVYFDGILYLGADRGQIYAYKSVKE